jgi:hypothetical protein
MSRLFLFALIACAAASVGCKTTESRMAQRSTRQTQYYAPKTVSEDPLLDSGQRPSIGLLASNPHERRERELLPLIPPEWQTDNGMIAVIVACGVLMSLILCRKRRE